MTAGNRESSPGAKVHVMDPGQLAAQKELKGGIPPGIAMCKPASNLRSVKESVSVQNEAVTVRVKCVTLMGRATI
jgi:hypothetical protein